MINLYFAILLIAIQLIVFVKSNDNLRVAYEWKQIDFEYATAQVRADAILNKTYIPENVVPLGMEVHRSRLFVTCPRWKPGVPASLAYIDLNGYDFNSPKSPLLRPYPNWKAHRLDGTEAPEIVSPFRIRADKCGRLWVLDTGINDILNETTQMAPPRLLIYDMNIDLLIRSYTFPEGQYKKSSFFANIAVEDDVCDDTFAYCADSMHPGLVVYSWKDNKSWRMTHHYFHPDPLSGNFSIGGIQFHLDDGLFGLALSKQQLDGYSTLYFHPLCSTLEFSVSTKILRSKELATSKDMYHYFKIIGTRGPSGQSGASFLHKPSGVLFYALPNLNAVGCWKSSNRAYTIKSHGRVYMNNIEMVFPNDIKVDDEDQLWVLSNRLQKFMYSELNPQDINFRILTATVKDAIEHTVCDINCKQLPDIITKTC